MVCKQVMQYKQIQRTVDKTFGITHGHVETQTNRQTDRLIFPLIHWHGTHFMVIIILWALNSAECQKRTKQTQTYSEVQSHQRQTSLLSPTRPPGLCSTYQPVSSNLSQTQRLTAVKWDQKTGNSFSLPFTGVYGSVCVVKCTTDLADGDKKVQGS